MLPLLGWRTWGAIRAGCSSLNLSGFREAFELIGASGCFWPSATLSAECIAGEHGIKHSQRLTPMADCSCGIYATIDPTHPRLPEQMWNMFEYDWVPVVKGAVALTGRIFVHPDGVIRAERARILCFVKPPMAEQLGPWLAEHYGVPVFDPDQGLQMERYLSEHAQRWRHRLPAPPGASESEDASEGAKA